MDTGGFAELDAMDEFGLADLDLDDDWDPVHGNHDSSGHHDRSAFQALLRTIACHACSIIICPSLAMACACRNAHAAA